MSHLTRTTNLSNFRRIKMRNTELYKSSNKPNLPVEVWIPIIEIVINDSVPTFEHCTSTEFLQFLDNWKCKPLTYARYFKHPESERASASKYEWTNLRLVCRAWSDIVEHICKQRYPILNADDPSLLMGIRRSNIKSLRVFDFNGVWEGVASSVRPYPLHRDLAQVGRNISTIIVSTDYSHISKGFLSLLTHHHDYFPNVRSLSIDINSHISPLLLSGIEKGFPQLTSLRLTGYSVHRDGRIYLPNLKIFESSTNSHTLNCNFPALTHASLRISWLLHDPYPRVLNQNSSRLESLVVWSNGHYSFRPFRTFTKFPNLRLFGATTRTLRDLLPSLPRQRNHPLKHIWILDCTNDSIQVINDILRKVKRLKRLTITPNDLLPGILNYIRESCQRKGVALGETTTMVNLDPSGPIPR